MSFSSIGLAALAEAADHVEVASRHESTGSVGRASPSIAGSEDAHSLGGNIPYLRQPQFDGNLHNSRPASPLAFGDGSFHTAATPDQNRPATASSNSQARAGARTSAKPRFSDSGNSTGLQQQQQQQQQRAESASVALDPSFEPYDEAAGQALMAEFNTIPTDKIDTLPGAADSRRPMPSTPQNLSYDSRFATPDASSMSATNATPMATSSIKKRKRKSGASTTDVEGTPIVLQEGGAGDETPDGERKKRKHPTPRPDKQCIECGTRETSVWRRHVDGELLCNKCGLRFRKQVIKEEKAAGTYQAMPRGPKPKFKTEAQQAMQQRAILQHQQHFPLQQHQPRLVPVTTEEDAARQIKALGDSQSAEAAPPTDSKPELSTPVKTDSSLTAPADQPSPATQLQQLMQIDPALIAEAVARANDIGAPIPGLASAVKAASGLTHALPMLDGLDADAAIAEALGQQDNKAVAAVPATPVPAAKASTPASKKALKDSQPLVSAERACRNCSTRWSPAWRKRQDGAPLCNSCYLRERRRNGKAAAAATQSQNASPAQPAPVSTAATPAAGPVATQSNDAAQTPSRPPAEATATAQ